MQRLAPAGLAVLAALSLMAGVAAASTFAVGSTAIPSGNPAPQACNPAGVFSQSMGVPTAAPSTIAAGGQLTQWQVNTAIDSTGAAGGAIELVALTPEVGFYRIDAVDQETLPNPLPANGVATFTPASPMMVSAGDILGLSGASTVNCAWTALGYTGEIFAADPVTPADVFSPLTSGPLAVAVAATVASTEDSAITTAVLPGGTVPAGGAALLASTVTDKGPAGNPLTFTDAVPSGLTITTAFSPSGPCTTVGQVVTCTLSGLAAGQSAPVDIIVTPRSGTYTNSVTVTQPTAATDPVTTNNKATATFTAVTASTKCVVTSLGNVPLSTAKKLLGALNCKVGKVSKAFSSKVAKGNVVKTTPGKGSFAAGTKIAIVESSGPKPKPKKHKGGKH
jgi:Domain of unknown function DUF11/PASTA domain